MDRLKLLLATGAGTGYLPIAPGTWASGVVTLLYLALLLGGAGPTATWVVMAILAGASVVGCVAVGALAERHFGRKDPGQMTLDEWAGQALAYIALPGGATWAAALPGAIVGFLAFRVLDIIKPPPARGIQRLPAGWGIAIDDVIAGIYANLVGQLVLRLLLPIL